MQTNITVSKQISDLTRELGNSLKVPEPEKALFKQTYRLGTNKGKTTWSYRYSKTRRTIRVSSAQREEILNELHRKMTTFAVDWARELKENPDLETLNTPLENQAGFLADYLGCWGHNKININTAPPEVMEAAFRPLGFTGAMAQAIVDYRRQYPFTRKNNVSKVPDIDANILRALHYLTTPTSDTFSVRISARLGRARFELAGGVYKNSRNQLVNTAVLQETEL